jgi:hypothetical protein
MKKNRMIMGMLTGALMLAGLIFTSIPAKAESHFSVGIGFGPSYGYYAPPPVAYRPPYPGPGYYWTDGYYDPYGSWINGFWAPPAYIRPYRYGYVAPRYYGGGYRRDFREGRGYWNGRRR